MNDKHVETKDSSKGSSETHQYNSQMVPLKNEQLLLEQSLRESEQRYSAIFNNSPFAMALTKMPEGITVNVNEKFLSLFEFTREEVIGRTSVDIGISDPNSRAKVAEELAAYGHVHDFEVIRTTKSGSQRVLALNLDWVSINNEKHILTTINDITERKQTEEKLTHEHEFLQQIIENIPVLLVIWDAQLQKFRLNNHAEKVLGWTTKDANNGDFISKVYPDDDYRSQVTSYMHSLIPGWHEWDVTAKDGHHVPSDWANISLSDNTMIGIGIDLQERKQVEEALHEKEKLYRLMAENTSDVIWVMDAETQHFLYVSPSVQKMRGYSPDEVMEHPASAALTPESWKSINESIIARTRQFLVEAKPFSFVDEVDQPCKDGSIIHTEITTTYILNEKGHLEIIGVTRDITERKQAEQEREISVEFLQLVNESKNLSDLIHTATNFFQQKSGCEAVGIRLKMDEDYPYYESHGFPKEFILLENQLCARDINGQLIRNSSGNPVLECMCGNVISGRSDPSKPFFTPKGSFWTNNTTALLASTSEADRQARTRNRCNGEGYESVALIGLRLGEQRLGLLQLNDKRTGLFTPEIIALWERLADYLTVALSKFIAEKSLYESEEKLKLFIEHAPAALAMFDQQMRYLAVSQRWIADYRLDNQNVLGRSHYDIFPEIPERWKVAHRRGLKGEIIRVDEDHFLRQDGSDQWLHWEVRPWYTIDNTIGGIMIFSEDITDRKQREIELDRYRNHLEDLIQERTMALEQSETRFRQLFEHAPDSIVMIDAETEEIVAFNTRAHECLGYSRDEFQKLRIPDIEAIESPEEVAAHIKKVLQSGIDIFETQHRTKDNKILDIRVSLGSFHIGEKIYLQSIWTDITDQKLIIKALRQSQQTTLQRQRLLLSLSQAAQEIQSTHTLQEAYETTGKKIQQLGFHAMILLLDNEKHQLHVDYLTFETTILHIAEELAQVTAYNYQFDILPESSYDQILKNGNTTFYADIAQPMAESLPHLSRDEIDKLIALLKLKEVIYAPLITGTETLGLLGVSGVGLTDSDIPAVTIFANQVAVTLEKIQADQILQASEEKFRGLYESLRDGVVHMDLEGKILECNPAFCELVGYSQDRLQKMTRNDLTPKKWQAMETEIITNKVMKKGYSGIYQTEFSHKNGSTIPITIRSWLVQNVSDEEPVGIWSIVRDVSDQIKAQQTEKMQATITQNMTEGVLMIQTKDNRIIYTNESFNRMFDYANGELIEQPVSNLNLHDNTLQQFLHASIHHIGENDVWRGEIFTQKNDCIPFWCETSISAIDDSQLGRVWVMVSQDISERKQAEEELEKHRHHLEELVQERTIELERSNKELEQFAYVASHDLQEPLRMVSSYTQLLANRYGDQLDQDAHDFIHYAVDGANRMQRLIQDLLSYSRVTTRGHPFEAVDLHDVLGEAVVNLQLSISESGALVSNGDLPVINGDRSQLVRVFQNLIDNAIKFRKPDESPLVHISAMPASSFVLETNGKAVEKNGEWIISIKDNGIGIDPKYFERIFVIFQRLHASKEYPGTGIGLALCQRIITRHGGKIWVESSLGDGATFYFTLFAQPIG